MTGLLTYDAASMDFEASSESTVPVPREAMRLKVAHSLDSREPFTRRRSDTS